MSETDASSIRVVIVDDDDLYRAYVKAILQKDLRHCEMFFAVDGTSTIAILDTTNIDCVILDYDLGSENGIAVGQLIQGRYSDPPPIVMLTGKAKDRVIVMALRGGFSDFVMKKTLSPDELIGAVRGAIDRKLRERIERSEHTRLMRQSGFDGVTGLRTRDFMEERSGELVASAIRRGGNCAAIIVRPREFEGVGDTFGHVIRDQAIRLFARRLQEAARESDVCGHYGKDSFLYLIDRDATPSTIVAICERLSRDLCVVANFDEVSFALTTEIGGALFPEAATTANLLLEAADRALRNAQSRGVAFIVAPPISSGTEAAQSSNRLTDGAVATENRYTEQSRLTVSRQTDRRREARQRVLKRGKICVYGIQSLIDCTIRDMSTGGARLRLVHYYMIPDKFDLLVVDLGQRRPVAVIWRLGNDLGVQFLQE